MSPIIKKAATALALKELFDRVQEARRPNQSFVARNKGKALWGTLLAGAAYLYKNGKLNGIVSQAKGLAGKPSQSEPAAYPTGPTLETHGPVSERSEADRPLEPSHN